MEFEKDTYSYIFLAVKHPVRRKILNMLNESPATYSQILNKLKVETGFLNYHLGRLDGLVAKNEHDQYILSDFGEAALSLTKRVEEPVERKPEKFRVFGSKFAAPVLLTIVVVSIGLNAYWIYRSQELLNEKLNVLGGIIVQTKGLLGESMSILNTTVRKNTIEFEIWDVMFRDLIQLSRQFSLIGSLDKDHVHQWSQIKAGIDSLIDFTNEIIQTYAVNSTRIDMTTEQSEYLNNIGTHLLNIYEKALPDSVIIGSSPRVNIIDQEVTDAMQSAIRLQADINFARKAFALPTD